MKSKNGFCNITLLKDRESLIIYRIDDKGNPVLNEEEVLIIECRPSSYTTFSDISISAPNYKFVKQRTLVRSNKKEKSNLSEEQWIKLRDIFRNRKNKLVKIVKNV